MNFATVTLVVGFAVNLGATANRYRSAGFVLLRVCLAHLLVIIAEYQQDLSSHNLAPFEFAILTLSLPPTYAGAGIAHSVDSVRRRKLWS